MVGSIVVVGVLTHCALIPFMFDLKAAQMNVQRSLIWKPIFSKFLKLHAQSAGAVEYTDCTSAEG